MTLSQMAVYRSVWRWHFYAGIIIAPFLFILSVTGAIYLFNDEINDLLHHDKRFADSQGEAVPLGKVAQGALKDYPGGKVTRVDSPIASGRTYQVFVTPQTGEPVRVFVEPATGQALGSYVYRTTLIGFADQMHGSLLLGDFGDAVVEIAACWGLILAVTGIYLWWPRGRARFHQALVPKFEAKGRRFWKSFHAAAGFWTAFLMAFLILSGLPWSTVWGSMFRAATQVAGVGYPESYRAHGARASTLLTVKESAGNAAPWTIEGMPAPQLDPHAGHHNHGLASTPVGSETISLDRVAAVLAQNGMHDPYRLSIPADKTGVYSAFTYPDQPEGQRTIYIDQYSGEIIRDIGFKDYGVAAKAVELGVQLHMGNYLGLINQIIMLFACIGIAFLSVTGPYMWWLRKPKGSFGAPQAATPATMRTIALIVASIGVLFPLAGASLIIVLLGDYIVRKLNGGADEPTVLTPRA